MLREFVLQNRQEVIDRCRSKVELRLGHPGSTVAPEEVVPMFLDQLVDKLVNPDENQDYGPVLANAEWSELRETASLHGAEMLKSRYTVKEVVQEYGDVCQAVTELAHEKDVAVSAREFGILNLCLDCAIAYAVASFGKARDGIVSDRAEDLHARLEQFSLDHERVTKIAAEALSAMQAGSVGVNGATARLLEQSLDELSWLIKRVLPELRLASAKTTVN